MRFFSLFVCVLSLVTMSVRAQTAPTRPKIAHEAPTSVAAGQPLRLVARVGHSRPIAEVTLHVAQSGGTAPQRIVMRPAGAGVYVGHVDPRLFAGAQSFRYYMEARDNVGVRSETNWTTVRVISGAAAPEKEGSWQKPVLIGAGAAVAIGAGVALAGSGGGGDSNTPPPDPGDPADQLIVRSASDTVSSPAPALPKVNTLDAASDLAGRNIRRVRIRLEFDGVDGGAETYEISYNGATVLSGSASGVKVEQVDVLGSADTQVLIRVLTSTPVAGLRAYNWNATVTYFLN
jgi:hypothetical protein